MTTDFKNIVDEVRLMNISDEDGLSFKSAVIIVWIIKNDTCNIMRIKRATDYLKKGVQFIIHNLRANGYILGYELNFDFTDEKSGWMEFILAAMASAGAVKRKHPDGKLFNSEEKPINWKEWQKINGIDYGD